VKSEAKMEAVLIDVAAGSAHESQSGLQLMRPRIWGAFHRAPGKVAAIVIHPTFNFMHHYILGRFRHAGLQRWA